MAATQREHSPTPVAVSPVDHARTQSRKRLRIEQPEFQAARSRIEDKNAHRYTRKWMKAALFSVYRSILADCYLPSRSFARSKNERNIFSVSLPVAVFWFLGCSWPAA
jgi:hypothetical protein